MFSLAVVEHSTSPRNTEPLPDADVVGQAGVPGEGPYMLMSLKWDGERIVATSFDTYGCPVVRACGSFVSEWAKGKTLEQASVLTASDLMLVMGNLPLGKEHCAKLSVEALLDAVRQQKGKGR